MCINANEPHLISGVATYAVEVFEECPDVDYIFVPIGGGSGACRLRHRPDARSAHEPKSSACRRFAPMRSRDRGADRFAWTGSAETFAEGIATRTTFDLTFTMLKSSLDDVVTLEESELEDGHVRRDRCTHNLAEGAGAAALAAARKAQPSGRRPRGLRHEWRQRRPAHAAPRACVTVSESGSMDQSEGSTPRRTFDASACFLHSCL